MEAILTVNLLILILAILNAGKEDCGLVDDGRHVDTDDVLGASLDGEPV